jgi:hypothetical protein
MAYEVIKTLEPNLLGRDFVVGDLHGSLSALVNLLAGVNFNPEIDRLISVGDLVDRGPDSLGCLDLIDEPWVHAAKANHEEMMLEAFNGGYMGNFWFQNGGFWGAAAYNDWQNLKKNSVVNLDKRVPEEKSQRLFDLLPKVEQLPFLITIKRPDGKKFHVIHAEFPPGYEITDEILEDPKKVYELATVQTSNGHHLLWGRYLFYNFYRADLSNIEKVKRTVAYNGSTKMFNDKLSHIISGHTILQRPMTIVGQTNIDTGAYGSYHSDASKWESLTCVELGTWTFYQATETEFRTVEPVTINREDLPLVQGQP